MTLDNYNIFNDEYLFGMPLSPLPKVVRVYCYLKASILVPPIGILKSKSYQWRSVCSEISRIPYCLHMLLPLVLDGAWLVAFAYRCQLNSWKLEIPFLVFYACQCTYYMYNLFRVEAILFLMGLCLFSADKRRRPPICRLFLIPRSTDLRSLPKLNYSILFAFFSSKLISRVLLAVASVFGPDSSLISKTLSFWALNTFIWWIVNGYNDFRVLVIIYLLLVWRPEDKLFMTKICF